MNSYEIQYLGPGVWDVTEYNPDRAYLDYHTCQSFEECLQYIWGRSGRIPTIKVEVR